MTIFKPRERSNLTLGIYYWLAVGSVCLVVYALGRF